MFVGEQEYIQHRRAYIGLIPAATEARKLFMEEAINEATSIEDLKPILLRLLRGN